MEVIKKTDLSEQKKELLSALKQLSKDYSEAYTRSQQPSITKKDVEERHKELRKSGQLIIDFYKKIFMPQYAQYADPFFQDTGHSLGDFSALADECIRADSYFGLGVLLIERGASNRDPNDLEALIQRLEKRV